MDMWMVVDECDRCEIQYGFLPGSCGVCYGKVDDNKTCSRGCEITNNSKGVIPNMVIEDLNHKNKELKEEVKKLRDTYLPVPKKTKVSRRIVCD